VADRVTITIGNAGIATFSRRLDVLPGDFNDDGVVNSRDIVGVRNELLGMAAITIYGDINGDGVVDIKDYNAVRAAIGTRLPTAG
jgi:Dockerin type I domain